MDNLGNMSIYTYFGVDQNHSVMPLFSINWWGKGAPENEQINTMWDLACQQAKGILPRPTRFSVVHTHQIDVPEAARKPLILMPGQNGQRA